MTVIGIEYEVEGARPRGRRKKTWGFSTPTLVTELHAYVTMCTDLRVRLKKKIVKLDRK